MPIARQRWLADEMVAHGTDRYGREHTPQFAGLLMRTSPPVLPPDPVFARKGSCLDVRSVVNLPNIYRSGNLAHKITLRGGDVADDAALYQLMYALSRDPAFASFCGTGPGFIAQISALRVQTKIESHGSSRTRTPLLASTLPPPPPARLDPPGYNRAERCPIQPDSPQIPRRQASAPTITTAKTLPG